MKPKVEDIVVPDAEQAMARFQALLSKLVHRTISSLLYSPFSGGGAEAFGDERFDSLGSPR